jgi:ABC-type antimicrobial peptide transport system permease subunit
MNTWTIIRRSAVFFHRSNLAVALGCVVATAVLTGALLVGDSLRAHLRSTALARLCGIEYAIVSQGFFRAELARNLDRARSDHHSDLRIAPTILVSAAISHAETRARSNRVNVIGVSAELPALLGDGASSIAPGTVPPSATTDGVVLNDALAAEIGAAVGDEVVLRLPRPDDAPLESLLGQRDRRTIARRWVVRGIVPAEGAGAVSLRPGHDVPRNVFAPLALLQGALGREDEVNALLIAGRTRHEQPVPPDLDAALASALARSVALEDVGLVLRVSETHGYLAVESTGFFLEPHVEEAAREAARAIGATPAAVLAYVANRIRPVEGTSEGIPYSTVVALDDTAVRSADLETVRAAPGDAGEQPPETTITDGTIRLNEWAANDLGASPGDRIELEYYVTGPFGSVESRTATFTLSAVVAMSGGAIDRGFTPEYRGVTDVAHLSDWDPPFPVDLRRVRERDESYWETYRTAPKGFLSLADGQRLWARQQDRFGAVSSIRAYPREGVEPAALVDTFRAELRSRLDPARFGLVFDPVRRRALASGAGSTDFGGLFLAFSLFLIASAAMLIALLFRLGVEQRRPQLGVLLAVGFHARRVWAMLLAEGTVVAALGGGVGVVAALGYGWLMLAGLRTWWSAAVHAPAIELHAAPRTLLGGWLAGVVVAVAAQSAALRSLRKIAPHVLLSKGVAIEDRARGRGGAARRSLLVGGAALVAALTLMAWGLSASDPAPGFFFGVGSLVLVGALCIVGDRLRRSPASAVVHGGASAWTRIGWRNARRHPSRNMLIVALIACGTFVVGSIGTFHREVDPTDLSRASGTGGFPLLAESTVPLPYDLNTPDGRDALNLGEAPLPPDFRAFPFRLRQGEETSCLNLYRPVQPRILGAPRGMIERGGFAFSASESTTPDDRENPWRLLLHDRPDGAVPAIGDESAIRWQLHSGLGEGWVITDGRGRPARLRFVALLSGSALQGEIIVSQEQFVRLFPDTQGYGFFLIETPAAATASVAHALEDGLSDFGFDVSAAADRLASYLAVQNTYLRTFQTLGGLGLLLGTCGLGVVLLRHVGERRGELALMRAVGFSRGALSWMILAENAALVALGVAVGAVAAGLAVAPHMGSAGWGALLRALASVTGADLLVGLTTGVVAVAVVLRTPLIPALRRE